MRKKRGRGFKIAMLVLAALVLALVGVIGYGALAPTFSGGTTQSYDSYTVETGDIATSKSFSASINVLNSETFNNGREVVSIRELYVAGGQEVKSGDELMQLSDGTVLSATLDGVVNEMRFAKGDYVWPNAELVQICDLEHLQVALQVDEYDIDKVSVGQKCTVTIISLGLDFETEIAHVNRVSTASGTVAYYSVTAELLAPANVLPGMAASVTIASDTASGVMTLDLSALAYDEDRKPYVLQKSGDGYERVMLETGLSDGMKVEIKSGVSVGDTVYALNTAQQEDTGFTLGELYKRVVGETVVINDKSGGGRGSRQGGGEMPEGMTLPEGFTPPADAESSQGTRERTTRTEADSGDAPATNDAPAAEQPAQP